MNLTYTYRLKLTKRQEQRIDGWIGVCRLIWNMALEIKEDAHRKGISISFNDIEKQLKDVRADFDWIRDLPAATLIKMVQNLRLAYERFFKNGGFPKFKSKKNSLSLPFRQHKTDHAIRQLSSRSFILPKIGIVNVFKDRPVTGEIVFAHITKEAGKYYLKIVCETTSIDKNACDNQVGIDVGISNFAVLSDGTIVDHPKLLAASQRRLSIAHSKLNHLKRGGKNYLKQVLVMQVLYQKVKRQREDFLHKLSSSIIKNNGVISVERLNIAGMVKSNLSKQISDSGWGCFKKMLMYKAELCNRSFVEIDPRQTSQECFVCGHIDAGNRKTQSEFKCLNCGHENHADHNAAQNILRRGQRLLAQSTGNSLRLAKEP